MKDRPCKCKSSEYSHCTSYPIIYCCRSKKCIQDYTQMYEMLSVFYPLFSKGRDLRKLCGISFVHATLVLVLLLVCEAHTKKCLAHKCDTFLFPCSHYLHHQSNYCRSRKCVCGNIPVHSIFSLPILSRHRLWPRALFNSWSPKTVTILSIR